MVIVMVHLQRFLVLIFLKKMFISLSSSTKADIQLKPLNDISKASWE